MDLDLVTILIPLFGLLLGAVILVAASLWARGVESALGTASGSPSDSSSSGTSSGASSETDRRIPAVNPTTLFQPPEDAPPA